MPACIKHELQRQECKVEKRVVEKKMQKFAHSIFPLKNCWVNSVTQATINDIAKVQEKVVVSDTSLSE